MLSTRKIWVFAVVVVVLLAIAAAFPQYNDFNNDPAFQEQLIGRLYRNYLKVKRSPSIGLSLAEYMASPQGQDNFHFIPSGRK